MSKDFSPQELALRTKLAKDFPFYSQNVLKIRSKSGEIKPFVLNPPQMKLHEEAEGQVAKRGQVRAIVVKGRQQGCSSYIGARFYHRITHRKGCRAYILTHEQEATDNLFDMTMRFHQNCPSAMRPQTGAASAKELNFKLLDSGYGVGTAGSKAVGRSQTIQLFHGSEVAYWPFAETHAAGILQTVPKGEIGSGTEVWLESTADGIGNYFHSTWTKAINGENDFTPIFLPWFLSPEYRLTADGLRLDDEDRVYQNLYGLDLAQMAWRRSKIGELGPELFKREYPASVLEAFSTTGGRSFIPMTMVERAMASSADPFGAVVFGVDPARFGDDRTALAVREGRHVHWVRSWERLDTMDIVGTVKMHAAVFKPKVIFVDVVGIGAGVFDRMRELGMPVRAVNGGEKPSRPDRYFNKRAEMWGEMREWLKDAPCQLPRDEALASDLCGLQYKFDSKSCYVLEKKEDAKRRGVRSPDLGDALALTFAAPVPMFDAGGSFEPGGYVTSEGQSFEPEIA